MRIDRRLHTILIFLFLIAGPWFYSGYAQSDFGKVKVSAFTKSDYTAGTQNWEIVRDSFGRVYIANNEGLLVFNGRQWQTFPVPNKTIVRSIVFGNDGKLYAGAQNEFGYYAANQNGKLVYTSLMTLLPSSLATFADIWNIEVLNGAVFFMATDIIFKYENQKLTAFPANSAWLSLRKHQQTLIAQDRERGLLRFTSGQWQPFILRESLPNGFLISDIQPFHQDTSLVSTSQHGLFLLHQQNLIPFALHTPKTDYNITALANFGHSGFLLGTYNNGILRIDRHGNVLEKITALQGLTGNTIRAIHTGSDGHSWIGLDNGIAMVEWNNPIRHINPTAFNNGSGHGAISFDNKMYFALTTGLQSLSLAPKDPLNSMDSEPNILMKGLTWSVSVSGKKIIVGRDDGLWQISEDQPKLISSNTGYWTFKPIPGSSPETMVSGNYLGIQFFQESKGEFIETGKVNKFIESSRYVELEQNNIWVSHPYHGLFKIDTEHQNITRFTAAHGLPANLENYVFKLQNNIYIATQNGIYEPVAGSDTFILSSRFSSLLGNKAIRYLKEDLEGNIWFVQDKMLGVIDFSGGKPIVKYIPEMYNHVLSGFENIYPYDKENVFVGSDVGFYSINYRKYREKTYPYFTYLTSVKLIAQGDSVLFGGFHRPGGRSNEKVSLPYENNSIQFSFGTSLITDKPVTEFSYFLAGYDKKWSHWSVKHEKEYTNLPEGNYVFHVKGRFGPFNEFKEYTYAFSIEAPWYRTDWAYFLYAFVFSLSIFTLLRVQKRRFMKKEQMRLLEEKKKFEEEQKIKEYHYQLEIEKKEKAIIQLKNQNLESALQHKNAELASTAMNLLQKKEFISKIADELTKVYLPIKDMVGSTEIKKILRSLSFKDNEEEEWRQFSIHFNNVHSNFLIVLKREFPELSAHDMKLCAYLRMNLSSKEIAQLLSISVRGVEISRYRLRKKLKLKPQEDLYQFLFNLTGETNEEDSISNF